MRGEKIEKRNDNKDAINRKEKRGTNERLVVSI